MSDPVDPESGLPLHRDVRSLTLTCKDESITLAMPGWYGNGSNNGIFDPGDMKVSDRALNRLKARKESLLEPEDIRRIRKKLALTQAVAGELVGGGPRAFQKYGNGDLLPNRAISSALVLLDRDPTGLAALMTRQVKPQAIDPQVAAPSSSAAI